MWLLIIDFINIVKTNNKAFRVRLIIVRNIFSSSHAHISRSSRECSLQLIPKREEHWQITSKRIAYNRINIVERIELLLFLVRIWRRTWVERLWRSKKYSRFSTNLSFCIIYIVSCHLTLFFIFCNSFNMTFKIFLIKLFVSKFHYFLLYFFARYFNYNIGQFFVKSEIFVLFKYAQTYLIVLSRNL